jgi:hypothetical protein
VPGFFTADIVEAETGFRAPDFLTVAAVALVSRAMTFPAASFLAVAVAVPAGLLAVTRAVFAFRADNRDGKIFRIAAFVASRFAVVVPARAVFGFLAGTRGVFAAVTLTRPRMARPDDRAFDAAAVVVGRRVDLLRGVEAMGTTLVTVATR